MNLETAGAKGRQLCWDEVVRRTSLDVVWPPFSLRYVICPRRAAEEPVCYIAGKSVL